MQPEDVFRGANEAIAQKARELGWHSPVPFLCECSDRQCWSRVDLTVEEYEDVRRHPQRYLIHRGHQVSEAFLLEQDEQVALVEKL
jgi:hypothetical protein